MNSKQSYVTELGETDDIVLVGDFNTSLSSRQHINKETLDHTLVQMDLTDMHRTFQPNRSRIHILLKYIRTFSMTGHTIGPKTSLSFPATML